MLGRLAVLCLNAILKRLPRGRAEEFLASALKKRCIDLPADEALRFLFQIEDRLYRLQAVMATEREGGLHPKHRLTGYHDFFASRIKAGERVLDVGCGNGALACDLARRCGCRVTGIDLRPQNIEKARADFSHPHVEYVVGDALRDLPGGKFDVVVLSNVLEHLDGRAEFLRRLTASTGARRFLVRVPFFERDWRVPLRRELWVEWRLDAEHKTEYTLKTFQKEMADAGMTAVHQEVRWGEIWAEAHIAEGR